MVRALEGLLELLSKLLWASYVNFILFKLAVSRYPRVQWFVLLIFFFFSKKFQHTSDNSEGFIIHLVLYSLCVAC